MAELFKFRCFQCGKLLGVSPRKVGRPVHCPRCGTELIVPPPADLDAADGDEPHDFADLGIDLGFASPLDIRPPEHVSTPVVKSAPDEAEALAFLDRMTVEGLTEPEPTPIESAAPDESTGSADGEDDEPEPLVATSTEPLASGPRSGRLRAATADRRRDVNLPRTAVTAWAMFALLALGLSFVAGLLLGHYHWK